MKARLLIALLLWIGSFAPAADAAPNPTANLQSVAARQVLQPLSAEPVLELVGQTGGPSYTVEVYGSRAYVGIGPRLFILDIADPANPSALGQVILEGVVHGVAVSGTLAYVAADRAGLGIVDVSNPRAPRPAGYADTPGKAYAVAVSNGLAYVADWNHDLRVIDVSNPAQPLEVGSLEVGPFAEDVAIAGGHAYVAAEAAGLKVLDLSKPIASSVVATYTAPASVWSVALSGNRAYLAYGGSLWNGVEILDISNPASISRIGQFTQTAGIALDVAAAGNTAYVVDQAGLKVLNVQNPALPQLAGQAATPGASTPCPVTPGGSIIPCRKVAAAGQFAYVADDAYGLRVLSTANPALPVEVNALETIGRIKDVAAYVATAGAFAFTAGSRGFHAVRMTDPTQPVASGSYPTAKIQQAVAVSGTRAYLGGQDGMRVLNVSNPASPALLGQGLAGQNILALTPAGNFVFAGSNWLGMRVYSVTNPLMPTEVGSFADPGGGPDVYAIALAGSHAYLATGGLLKVVNIATPSAPYQVGEYPSGFLTYRYSAAASGQRVYSTNWDALEILDVTNPGSPTLAGQWNGIGWGQDVAVAGARAYVAAEQYGVFVLDVSVPATPTLVAQVETPGLARSIALQENLIYVGLDDGGLGILSLVQPASASITPAGGALATPDGAIAYTFPAGAFTGTVAITLTPRLDGQVPTGGMLRGVGRAFEIEAVHAASGQPAQPARPYTVVVRYDPSRLGPVIENTLDLYRWDVGLGLWISATGALNLATHTITAQPGRFSQWSVMGRSRRVFVPIMRK